MLRIAVPNKGSLSEAASAMLREAGYSQRRESRELILDDPANGWTLRPITPGVAGAVRRVSRREVPDMPDRIIAATALDLKLPLVTADGRIRASSVVHTSSGAVCSSTRVSSCWSAQSVK